MMLQSMTGFSRLDGQIGRYQWAWELRSVNGKGLDIRLRLPPGQERLEAEARRCLGQYFARGNIQASLTLQTGEGRLTAVVNDAALTAIIALRERLGDLIDPAPLKLDTLLSIRGVVDFKEEQDDESAADALERAVLDGLDHAARAMRDMRQAEGAALEGILAGHIDAVERLTGIIAQDPSRAPEQIRIRLQAQISALMDTNIALERERLYAEVALLATKADIREEIDRLNAHITAARDLFAKGGPVGRKLDFLAQEFNRESNTICSKSNSAAVTAAGIELKVVIDQFREQVQNLE